MKILMISDPGTVGGATRSLVDVATELTRRGEKIIVCTSIYNDLNEELNSLGINNFACGHQSAMNTKSPYRWKRPLKYPYECLRYYLSIPKAIEQIENAVDLKYIDIIHTNSARNDIGCLLSKKYGIPHIVHIREFGQEDFDCYSCRPNYYQFLNRYSDGFIAISKAVANSWIKKGIDPKKVRIVYNGIDFPSDIMTDKVFDNDKIKMIIAGGICEAKGQLQCVEAMSKISWSVLKHITLDMIGWTDSRYEEKIRNKIAGYDLQDKIRILKPQKNIYGLLSNYDIGLMCSRSEGFGRVTAEYMLAGLAVIASNAGANPELIGNDRGILYELGNTEMLAEKIEMLYSNRSVLADTARKGKNYAHQAFTIEHNVSEIMKIYQSVKKNRLEEF